MNLLRDDSDKKYVVFDTETEGLSLIGKNRPWQIGYIVYQNGKILKQSERFIKWDDLSLSDGAAKVTRFDWDEYKRKAEDPNKVLDDLETYFADQSFVYIAHNVSNFDAYIIKNWREALGRKNDYSYLDRTIDSNSLARAIKKGVKKIEKKDWKLMMFRFANYRERGMKTSLTALGKEFGVDHDYESLHRGLSDVVLNVKVWEQLKYKIDI